MTDDQDAGNDGEDGVEGVADEAVKLLRALQDWAMESGSEYASGYASGHASGTASAAAGAAGMLHDVNEHVATGSAECRYCPVCQLISAFRGTSPEVRQHLATAASSLVQAVSGVLAPHSPTQGNGRRPEPSVQKIDLDPEPDEHRHSDPKGAEDGWD